MTCSRPRKSACLRTYSIKWVATTHHDCFLLPLCNTKKDFFQICLFWKRSSFSMDRGCATVAQMFLLPRSSKDWTFCMLTTWYMLAINTDEYSWNPAAVKLFGFVFNFLYFQDVITNTRNTLVTCQTNREFTLTI